MRKILSLILSVLAFPALSDPIDENVWQAMASLERFGKPFCKATLVAPDKVITAGHCVKSAPPEVDDYATWSVVFPDGERVGVVNAATVPGFNYVNLDEAPVEVMSVDLGVLQLDRSLSRDDVNILGFQEAVDGEVWVPLENTWSKCIARQMPPREVFHIGCFRERGYSGSPVFRRNKDGVHIVGIISALDPIEGGVFAHNMETTLASLIWNGDPSQ